MGAWDPKAYITESNDIQVSTSYRMVMGNGEFDSRITLGVWALQKELKYNGHDPGPLDGMFGAKTRAAAQSFQIAKDISHDGIIGAITARALFMKRIKAAQDNHEIPDGYLCGQIRNESAFDPAALGSNGFDTGLVQINLEAHPEISRKQAHDPAFSIPYSAQRMREAYEKYLKICPKKAWDCAIAQHKNPAAAWNWCRYGTPMSDATQTYVFRVKQGC